MLVPKVRSSPKDAFSRSITDLDVDANFVCRDLPFIVKNDTFRTLATDTDFKGRVREDMLIRLLEAFVWRSQGEPSKVDRMWLLR